jgi:anti-sigma factor RsiW
MSCSPFDLRDYFFGELSKADRQSVDKHISACSGCREELDRLQMTNTALLSIRDEEPPRRIAFVSDKVFEPSWWQRIWQSGAKLGFASAAMLSVAIVAHAYIAAPRLYVQQVHPTTKIQQAIPASVDAAVRDEVERQLKPVVEQVVADSEKRQAARIAAVTDEQKRSREDLNSLGETVGYMRRTFGNLARVSMDTTPGVGQ